MPLVSMVSNMSGHGLAESSEEIQHSIMLYKELEKGKKCLSDSFEGTICPFVFVEIPLCF